MVVRLSHVKSYEQLKSLYQKTCHETVHNQEKEADITQNYRLRPERDGCGPHSIQNFTFHIK